MKVPHLEGPSPRWWETPLPAGTRTKHFVEEICTEMLLAPLGGFMVPIRVARIPPTTPAPLSKKTHQDHWSCLIVFAPLDIKLFIIKYDPRQPQFNVAGKSRKVAVSLVWGSGTQRCREPRSWLWQARSAGAERVFLIFNWFSYLVKDSSRNWLTAKKAGKSVFFLLPKKGRQLRMTAGTSEILKSRKKRVQIWLQETLLSLINQLVLIV